MLPFVAFFVVAQWPCREADANEGKNGIHLLIQ